MKKFLLVCSLVGALFIVPKIVFAAESPPPMPSLPPSAPETGTTAGEEVPEAPSASAPAAAETTEAAETTTTGPETGLVILLSVLGASGLYGIFKKR